MSSPSHKVTRIYIVRLTGNEITWIVAGLTLMKKFHDRKMLAQLIARLVNAK